MMRRALLLVLFASMAGCAVGPNYQPPRLLPKTRSAFIEASADSLLSGRPLPPRWWALFNDPVLDRLIDDAFAYNTSILQAEASLRQARGVLAEQRAGLLPTTTVSAGYTHARVGDYSLGSTGTVTGAGTSAAAPSGFTYDFYQVGFDASYEVDIFGRVRRSVEAAKGEVEASRAALDGVRISVAAQVAQSRPMSRGTLRCSRDARWR
jgi:outer membrane protein TolC